MQTTLDWQAEEYLWRRLELSHNRPHGVENTEGGAETKEQQRGGEGLQTERRSPDQKAPLLSRGMPAAKKPRDEAGCQAINWETHWFNSHGLEAF